ncbi:MAG TPA: hypothetical protein VJS38_18025 [Phenylobacterium sp.]|uniref:hypothetical protein n=1 Tax=Phenylobacterium sp. TaxID=1871053 RepID=UPI002B47C46A|nr:hypothetical protein [Phenylobacterium sp.]HKR90070.1 hypothetical protein [Phenylobacterium sp.]
MRTLQLDLAKDDAVIDARLLFRQDDDLIVDFRRRMDSALKVLRKHEEAARREGGF